VAEFRWLDHARSQELVDELRWLDHARECFSKAGSSGQYLVSHSSPNTTLFPLNVLNTRVNFKVTANREKWHQVGGGLHKGGHLA
jgi:hypothetical protein